MPNAVVQLTAVKAKTMQDENCGVDLCLWLSTVTLEEFLSLIFADFERWRG